MNLYLKSVLIIITFLVSISCKKKFSETLVEGQVINEKTREPVENAEFIIYKYKNNIINPFLFESYIYLADKTDKNGKYKIKFKSEDKFYDYAICTVGAFGWGKDIKFLRSDTIRGIKNRKINKVNLQVTPIAHLDLTIKNLNPVNQNDFFEYKIITNNPKIRGDNRSWFAQTLIQESSSWLNAEDNNTISYSYVKNGIRTSKDTTFFAKSYEVKKITITY